MTRAAVKTVYRGFASGARKLGSKHTEKGLTQIEFKSREKSRLCLCFTTSQMNFLNFINEFLCFTNFYSVGACKLFHWSPVYSLPRCLCAREDVPSPAPRSFFSVKEVSLKKLAHLLYYFKCHTFFYHNCFLFIYSDPSVVCQRTLLLSGCMNLWWLDAEDSSQTVWSEYSPLWWWEKGHLWPSRRVITKVMHSSHIWKAVDDALDPGSVADKNKKLNSILILEFNIIEIHHPHTNREWSVCAALVSM